MRKVCTKRSGELLDTRAVRSLLVLHCQDAGGQSAFARSVGVSRAFIHSVIKGASPPSPKLLAAMGLRSAGERWTRAR